MNYSPTDNNQEKNSQIIQEQIIEDTRDDNSSARVELTEDVSFSGDSGKVNSEVGSTLSQEVKCPLSAVPVQTRKYDIPYGDAQLLVFFESLFDRKLYRSFIVFMLLIVSLILVMCHSILFSTETGGLQLMGI